MVTQKFIKPATYLVNGQKRPYSRAYLTKVASETNRMLADGLAVPYLGKHTQDPSDPAGLPTANKSDEAHKSTRGWLKGIKALDDGWLEYEADVTDPAALEAIKNGSVRFTSPQFTEHISVSEDGATIATERVDGLGRKYGPVISHMAMTPNPRNPIQGAIQFGESVQFSLDDIETEEAPADEEEPVEEEVAETPPSAEKNPNSPPTGDNGKSAAVVEGMHALGIMVPADWAEGMDEAKLDSAIAALNTKVAAKNEAEAAEASNQIDNSAPQEVDPVQFSADELAALPVNVRRALEQAAKDRSAAVQFALDKAEHRRTVALGQLKALSNLPPALRAKLLARAETVQFSADGEPATLTILEAAQLVSETLPAQFSADSLTTDTLREVDPPADGERREQSDAELEKTYTELMGGFRPMKQGA